MTCKNILVCTLALICYTTGNPVDFPSTPFIGTPWNDTTPGYVQGIVPGALQRFGDSDPRHSIWNPLKAQYAKSWGHDPWLTMQLTTARLINRTEKWRQQSPFFRLRGNPVGVAAPAAGIRGVEDDGTPIPTAPFWCNLG